MPEDVLTAAQLDSASPTICEPAVMSKLEPYPDLKLDLMMAFSLLDDHLTVAESWEVYVAIEMGAYDEALARMRMLATARAARDADEVLERVWRGCIVER